MAEETPVKEPEVKAEPVVETALGPAIETPKTEPVAEKPVEAPKAEEKPVEANPVEAKAPEAKPAEVKPSEAAKAAEAPKVEEAPKPVEPPKFEAFTLPEGVKLEDAQVKDIHSMLGNFEVASKASHAEVQKFGQAIVEYGLGIVKDAVARVNKEANDYWSQKTKEYRESFEKDPEIGGKKKAASAEAARQFIAQHAGSPEHAAEVRKILYDHKLADHPSIIRLLANANLERQEGKPLPAHKAVPMKKGKLDRWYGNMKD